MAEPGSEILFVTGRLAPGRDEIPSLRGLVVRLVEAGHGARVLCVSATPDHGLVDLTECPGLGRRWQRPWAVRGLGLDPGPGRPRIMHVLSTSMAEAGLEIAERWRLPYLQSVEDFPHRSTRIRVSRDWCRGFVVANRELAEALHRDFGIPRPSIREIPGGIAESEGGIVPVQAGRVPVVGAAGPLVPSSGFSTFLNAARRVLDLGLDVEFLIAGQGEVEGELRRRAERIRIADRLTFADEVPIGLDFWRVLDVFCQTSVAPTVGRPLLRAMAGGVPSIATDVEGLRSLVDPGESGLVVPHGDSVALAGSIVGLLEDRDRARLLGESGRRAVSRDHHPDRQAERLDLLYREVMAAGLGPQDSGLTRRIVGFEGPSGRDAARGAEMAGLSWLSQVV